MNIFFDFDDVLFHTRAFTDDLRRLFVQKCGLSLRDFDESYEMARKRDGIDNYSFHRHREILAKDYGIDKRLIEKTVRMFVSDLSRYVFADVHQSLATLQKNGHDLFLVTFGSPSLQRQKVIGSGLQRYFREMSIGEQDKATAISTLHSTYQMRDMVYCEDRGGAINGNHFDMWFTSRGVAFYGRFRFGALKDL